MSSLKLSVYLNLAIFTYHVEQKHKYAYNWLKKNIKDAIEAKQHVQTGTKEFRDISHQVEMMQENKMKWSERVNELGDSDEEN